MMDLGPHAGFIVVSYALCAATVLGLILWVRIDRAAQEKALRELADQGVSRRHTSQEDKTPS